jgi:predicted metal-dependent hydrolase
MFSEAPPGVVLETAAWCCGPARHEAGRKDAELARWYREKSGSRPAARGEVGTDRQSASPAGFRPAMKTKWGSCNDRARTIRLNTELAKKPKECLEYIVLRTRWCTTGTAPRERFVA